MAGNYIKTSGMPRGEGEVVFLPKKRKPPDIDDSQVITKTAVAAATKTAAATALIEIAVAAAAAAAAATAINRMAVAAAVAAAAAAVTKIAVAAAAKVAAAAAVNSIAVAAAAAASTLGIRKDSIVRPAVHLRLPTRCATATSSHLRAAVAVAAAAKAAAATAAAATPTSTAMSARKPDIGSISTLGIRKDSRLPTRCDTSGHHRGEHQQTCLSKPQLLQLSISSMQEHCNDTRVSCPGREHLLPGQLAISSAQPNVDAATWHA